MITRIAHVCIACTDLDAVERFYIQALGFSKKFDFIKNDRRVGCYLKIANGCFLEFFTADSVPNTPSPIRHLCLETDNIDNVIARLTTFGYTVGEKKLGADNSWQVWVKDAPDAVSIEFHQYTPQSSQYTGKDCIVNW